VKKISNQLWRTPVDDYGRGYVGVFLLINLVIWDKIWLHLGTILSWKKGPRAERDRTRGPHRGVDMALS
jgi:hypothetical protein